MSNNANHVGVLESEAEKRAPVWKEGKRLRRGMCSAWVGGRVVWGQWAARHQMTVQPSSVCASWLSPM
jgi:hypothetical protein